MYYLEALLPFLAAAAIGFVAYLIVVVLVIVGVVCSFRRNDDDE